MWIEHKEYQGTMHPSLRYFGLFNIYYLQPILFNEIKLKLQNYFSKKRYYIPQICEVGGGVKIEFSGRDQRSVTGSWKNVKM